MSKFIDLPEELLIIIIKKLDVCSLHNLYNTCKQTRRILQLPRVVKTFHMTLNTMASIESLKLQFFKDIAYNLLELNMCGVPDLKISPLLRAFKRLKNLKTLDVSHTDITINDYLELHKLCPTIKNISINFVFGNHGIKPISNGTIVHCQNVFENLENVHFVGSYLNLLGNNALSFTLLIKAKLNTLKYSVVQWYSLNTLIMTQDTFIGTGCIPNFNYFNVCFLNWKKNCNDVRTIRLPAWSALNLETYEFIIVVAISVVKSEVFVSSIFLNFFHIHFNSLNVKCLTNLDMPLPSNTSIMIWKKQTNKFDTVFYTRLFNEIKYYFPSYCVPETCAPVEYDWFYFLPQKQNYETKCYVKFEQEFKKRRLGAPNLVLNYDTVFKNKEKIQLSIILQSCVKGSVALKTNSDYLKKITFLSLHGSVNCNFEFFNILFDSCSNLITLCVDTFSVHLCNSLVLNMSPVNQSIKNLRIVDKRIDLLLLIITLSQCKSLENICIVEKGDPLNKNYKSLCDAISVLIENCDKLYNIYIETQMSESGKTKMFQSSNKTKKRCKRYALNIELLSKPFDDNVGFLYDPFISMFNIYPIKPIL